MWLRKSVVPGSAPGGFTWATAEESVEVPDDLAVELLGIRGAGFSEVAPPAPEPDPEPDPEPTSDADSSGEAGAEVDASAPAKRPGRPRKTPVAE